MHVRPNFKEIASSVGVILAVLLLGLTVADQQAQASKSQAVAVHASSKQTARSRYPSRLHSLLAQRKLQPIRRIKPILVADSTAAEKTTLLSIANQPSFTPAHRELADHVLRTLPAGCRTNLRNFYILYSDAKQRGLGGKSTIIIDGSVSDTELAALLTHECGHVIHSNMPGTVGGGESNFRDGTDMFYIDSPVIHFFNISWNTENVLNASATKHDFVSGYAKSDAFEDFAETFAMYVLQRDAFRTQAQTNAALAAKLAWMETYLPLGEDVLGNGIYSPGKDVPWDVTKLPYELAIKN